MTEDTITVASTTDTADEVRAAALWPAVEEESAEVEPEASGAEEAENEPEAEAGAEEAQEAEAEADAEAERKPGQKKGGYQKRIDKLTREKHELAERLAAIERRLAEPAAKPAETAKPAAEAPPAEKPKPSDYADYEEYLDARDAWKKDADQREAKAAEATRKAEEAARARSTEQAARVDAWKTQCEAAEERYDDFKAVAFQESTPISPAMQDAILDSDRGADIAYYLGQHQDEATRIAALSPVAAVRAIGRIEAALEPAAAPKSPAVKPPATEQPKTKASAAPKPIRPLSGASRQVQKNPDDMTIAEYRAWRDSGGGR